MRDSFWLCVNEKGVIMVTEKKIKKEKGVIVLAVLAFCALGLCLLKSPTEIWAQAITVHDVIEPRDIPAVAVELNKDSDEIVEKLAEVSYTVYTDTETLHIPVVWNVSSVNMKLAGVYTIKGVLKLPEEYDLGGISSPQVQTTVSVQYQDKPDINTYYRLTAAGLYIFPWIQQENPDSMEAYLKKDNGQWLNLTEEGFAFCDEEGLYVSNQSMTAGNTYSILVTYDNGEKQTGTLRFRYLKDGSLNIYSYQYSQIGDIQKPGNCIRSYDTSDEKYLSRCAAYAVKTGANLKKIKEELTEDIKLRVSTAQKFENTAENPEIMLESSWDVSRVNTSKSGVYKLTGTFVIPQGYELSDDLTLPEACAYISVQKKGNPQIDTYSMPAVDMIEFPMLMDGFSKADLQNMQVYIRENKGSYQKADKELVEITSRGVLLYCREVLKKGNTYDICVVHEKGSTGIYSFSYNDEFIVNEYWHERNFSDRDEKNLPDIVQKAPEIKLTITPVPDGAEADNAQNQESEEAGYENGSYDYNSVNAGSGQDNRNTGNKESGTKVTAETDTTNDSVTELSTDAITAVSGRRLLLMIQQNGSAKFEKQGISVTVSSETVNAWKVNENDEVQVRIEKTAELAFSLRIFVRGEEVTEIPGTVVKIPISVLKGIQSPETVVIEDTQGNQYAKSYQEEQKVLQVTLDKTGDYFITDGQSSNSVQENQGEAGADQTGFSVKDSETEVAVTDEIMQEDGEILSDMNDTGAVQESEESEHRESLLTGKDLKQSVKISLGLIIAGAVLLTGFLILRKKHRK